MNKLFILIAALSSSGAFAQSNDAPPAQRLPGDVVQTVTLDKMPIPLPPGEGEKMKKKSTVVASDGYSTVETAPEMVNAFKQHVLAAKTYVARQDAAKAKTGKADPNIPDVHKDLSKLKTTFKTKALPRGRLVAASTNGTQVADTWTGVDRFFEIDGAGSVRLSENDLAASGGKFFMMQEAINSKVHGKPAISKVFLDDKGQGIEEVL